VLLVVFKTLLLTKTRLLVYPVLVLAVLGWLSLVGLGLVNSLLWLYEGVLGVSEGLVITSRGFSPLTALVHYSEIESRLSNISDIVVEYYLVTPVLVNGELVILKSTNASVNLSSNCVLVGVELARELGVTSGDYMLVSSVFTGEVYCLEICGYTSGYVLEAPYDLVARIRGVTPGYYSYVVVRGSSEALSRVIEALGGRPGEFRLAGLITVVLTRIGDNRTRALLYRALTEAYITNFGLQRDYVLYFAYTVIVAGVLGSLILGLDVTRRVRSVLGVFRLMGVSKRALTVVTTLLGLTVSSVAYSTSLLLYMHLEFFTLSVLGYTLKPILTLEVALLVFSALTLLHTLGLLLGVYREVE